MKKPAAGFIRHARNMQLKQSKGMVALRERLWQ